MLAHSEELLDFQKEELIVCVDSCDTAYNVEKVCEQLGEKSFDIEIEDEHIVPESNIRETFNVSVIGIESAIEIVCSGGKE